MRDAVEIVAACPPACARHGWQVRHGSGRAIAFARESADVVINYLPKEESDAKEVVVLIKAAGRKAFAIPEDLSNESFCPLVCGQGRTTRVPIANSSATTNSGRTAFDFGKFCRLKFVDI
jgi:NAD(P)-dependent dehydrogenase (short-subunit alcohol dehydrogenase family)